MKKFLLLTLFLLSGTAHAYISGQSNPQNGGSYEAEYKTIVKSTTAGYNDAIAVGDVLSYDTVNVTDGYTVTRVNGLTVQDVGRLACIATKAIATGDVTQHQCLSRGYVPQLSYNSNSPSVATFVGKGMCGNASGQAISCPGTTNDGSGNDAKYGSATADAPITSLQAIPLGNTGSGATGLKAWAHFQ